METITRCGVVHEGRKGKRKMDTHGQSELGLSGEQVVGNAGQRGRHGLGEESNKVRSTLAGMAGFWQASSAKFVLLYLAAIIAANLITTAFGPAASVFNAFVLIALDLTSRDRLHEAWHKSHLTLKMTILIASGSILSYAFNRNSGQIAIASFVAFGAAAVTDTIVYQILYRHPWRVKVNTSNVFSAAVDSILFPTLAFGGLLPLVTLGQFAAKVAGGFVWSIVLSRRI